MHDRDPVGDVADDADVVGDEDVGEAELVLQVLEQVDDLRLDRDVEGGDRLVGDDQLRLYRQGPRDADPLALAGRIGLTLTPMTRDTAQAEEWLQKTEGTMAKQLDAPYIPGKRKGMAKVKREREIDCVVLGWRPGKEEGTVGSLILGLYDGEELRPVGHISGFSAAEKRAMPAMLAHLETGESGTAEPSRWTGGRDLEWVALRPELVIEVGYDHAAAGRIRHGARFRRFRDDKDPRECLFSDLDEG